jgi:hypothetical protein
VHLERRFLHRYAPPRSNLTYPLALLLSPLVASQLLWMTPVPDQLNWRKGSLLAPFSSWRRTVVVFVLRTHALADLVSGNNPPNYRLKLTKRPSSLVQSLILRRFAA